MYRRSKLAEKVKLEKEYDYIQHMDREKCNIKKSQILSVIQYLIMYGYGMNNEKENIRRLRLYLQRA